MTLAVYQAILKFNLYLGRAQCILHCDHKHLEPFLSCGMKIPKLNHWYRELSDYNLTFIHSHQEQYQYLVDAISRLETLDINKEPLDNPKTSNSMFCIAEIISSDRQILSIDQLCAE